MMMYRVTYSVCRLDRPNVSLDCTIDADGDRITDKLIRSLIDHLEEGLASPGVQESETFCASQSAEPENSSTDQQKGGDH